MNKQSGRYYGEVRYRTMYNDTEGELGATFIVNLDSGKKTEKHRMAIKKVLDDKGLIDLQESGYYFPYRVIMLGTRFQEGHEREYAACLGIILRNIETGYDQLNNLEDIIEAHREIISNLPDDLKDIITSLINRMLGWN